MTGITTPKALNKNQKKVPGPPALPIIGHLPGFRRDVLGLLEKSVREYGDLLRFKLGPREIFVVNHPDHVQQVLKKNARNYDKNTRSTRFLSDICGESLLTANGDEWHRRRHTLQPAFHHQAVQGFATIMHGETAALMDRIAGHNEIDVPSEMMQTTFRIVARALFGTDVSDSVTAKLEAPIETVLVEAFARLGSLTGRKTRAFKKAMRDIDAGVAAVLKSETDGSDLLALMRGEDYDEQALRNEAVNFLIAGHETTANALTWLFAHLATRPDEQERCATDPEALDRALSETLRLSPPIWVIERNTIGDDEISGYTIPAGAPVVVCTYTVHRHREFWDEPEKFDPDRFLKPPPPAYLPFGLGPRTCIGREFSLMEAKIIATALLGLYRFSPLSDSPPIPEPAITLRIRGGLCLKVNAIS